jgi:putative endopeptidase
MRFAAIVLLAAACASNLKAPSDSSAIDLQGIDRSVAPGDDFFAFANGSWMKSAEIPADRSSIGPGALLTELTAKRTADLIAEAGKAPKSDDEKKVSDYYESFMDEAAIEEKGLAPLKPQLERIASIKDKKELARALGETLRADVDVLNNTRLYTGNLFGLWVAQDFDDPKNYSGFLLQGGLGMPDRDYYLDPSSEMAAVREAYQTYITAILQLSGASEPAAKAERIFKLEKRIAEAHATRVDTEDVSKGNNHWKRFDFISNAPGLDWETFFAAAGLSGTLGLVVWQEDSAIAVSALVGEVPLEIWKEYLAFHAVDQLVAFLPKAFVETEFAFRGKALAGTPELRARWKRAVSATDGALGEAVGKIYVERYFPPAEKARAEELVKNLVNAFGKRIDALPWMSAATKEKAHAKLATLKVGVGYPDKWRDDSGLQIVRGDALGNAQRASLFEYKRNLTKLGKPVDRGEWVMNPQLVNAVNLPAMNALNFPAAILQPPFFDPSRPALMDYGAIGAVIGHEISHGFDNAGALFDANGLLHDWWTPEDLAHFQAAGAALAKQYDAYAPFPDLHVRGEQTLGENIADVAGLSAAYDAYRLSLAGKDAPERMGLSGDQQFFLSFAQSWRRKMREPALRQQIVVDGHSPAEYRADTVRNLDAWYPAFNVQSGQKLFLAPEARVRIW